MQTTSQNSVLSQLMGLPDYQGAWKLSAVTHNRNASFECIRESGQRFLPVKQKEKAKKAYKVLEKLFLFGFRVDCQSSGPF